MVKIIKHQFISFLFILIFLPGLIPKGRAQNGQVPMGRAPMPQDSLFDGPVVHYANGWCYVDQVVKRNRGLICLTDSFPEKEKQRHSIKVQFSANPKYNFSVPLLENNTVQPGIWPDNTKQLVLSDIEGEFEPFRNLLLAAKVINENYEWTFGKGILVICGDLFDRGHHVFGYTWLLYKLEQEASKAGGYVHVVLGNHDIMNMSGDIRYVQPEYMWIAQGMGVEYSLLVSDSSELGRWMRSKNIIEKIGSNLYLHAGISPEVNQLQYSIDKINELCRPFYALSQSDRVLKDSILSKFFYDSAPFWYRGYFLPPFATDLTIDSTCYLYSIKKIIVGHTILGNISAYYHERVIGVDVDQHEGTHEGLLIDGEHYNVIDDQGRKQPLVTFTR